MDNSNLLQKYNNELDKYNKDGFLSPVTILNNEQALFHRLELEKAENMGGKILSEKDLLNLVKKSDTDEISSSKTGTLDDWI